MPIFLVENMCEASVIFVEPACGEETQLLQFLFDVRACVHAWICLGYNFNIYAWISK